ncbi:MAG TPA: asparagine synthase-related protein [Acidimicrobiia bacterium]|jgi:asparagine synthase (glutamine-hydrolysing)
MSAITVVLDLSGAPLDAGAFDASFSANEGRGPDGSSSWIEGQIGLGHHSLSLAPEPGLGPQPATVESCVGVFDGRIDNRAELIETLAPGRAGETVSDAELAVRAYVRWGRDAAEHLLGDFGIAVWDRTKAELFCARDFIGTRPLYTWSNGRILVVATDIRAILAHPTMRAEPNLRHVADTLEWDLNDRTETLYLGVHRLPPAHMLSAVAGRVSTRRYWDIDLEAEERHGDARDYVEHFRSLLRDAVECRLRAPTAAVSLSGGLDSSMVAATMGALQSDGVDSVKLSATSTVYPGYDCDESKWIRLVANGVGLPAREVVWRPMSWETVLGEADRTQGIAPYPNMAAHMFARSGIRRELLLTGSGGDELMNGYDEYFRDLVVDRDIAGVLRAIREGAGFMFSRRVLQSVRAKTLDRVRTGADSREVGGPWLGPALAGIPRPPAPPISELSNRLPAARRHRYGVFHAPWESHTFDLADQALWAAELVTADPFCDRRLVEWAFAIPEAQRWHGTDHRWLERQALVGRVPDPVWQRTWKVEFSSTFVQQIHELPFADIARTSALVEEGWIDRQALERVGDKVARGGFFDELYRTWCFVSVDAWFRTSWS